MRRARRLLAELHRPPDASSSCARLRIDAEGRINADGRGAPPGEVRTTFDQVTIEEGVYASIPTTDARVRLLEAARALARGEVVLHVRVVDGGSYAARLLLDGARRLLPLAAEPGDRRDAHGTFRHAFFDEEPLLAEIAGAGLVVVSSRVSAFVLRAGSAPPERADPFYRELVRAAARVRDAERRRLHEAPEAAVRAMRARGAAAPLRGPVGRARLRRAIGWVDAFVPGGPNCYRRTLLELGLDAGAARETLVFGLDVGRTGHVAFSGREDRTFDVVYELQP